MNESNESNQIISIDNDNNDNWNFFIQIQLFRFQIRQCLRFDSDSDTILKNKLTKSTKSN